MEHYGFDNWFAPRLPRRDPLGEFVLIAGIHRSAKYPHRYPKCKPSHLLFNSLSAQNF